MEVKFISNNLAPQAHDKHIVKLIENSDEVWIAVAFLKESGFNIIREVLQEKLNEGKDIHIVVGLYFGITDPAALTALLEMNGIGKLNLYMAKDGVNERNFHPKLYIFRSGKNYTIISGSANITNGGLTKNIECSLQVTANEDESVCKDANEFMEVLMEKENSNIADDVLISNYKEWWLKQQVAKKGIESTPGVAVYEDVQATERHYYRVTLGLKNSLVKEGHINDFVGLDYQIPNNLTDDLKGTFKEFKKKYTKIFLDNNLDKTKNAAGQDLPMLWELAKEIQIGDIVLVNDGTNKNYYVGKIVGPYEHKTDAAHLPHRRTVKWYHNKISKINMSPELVENMRKYQTGSCKEITAGTYTIDEFIKDEDAKIDNQIN